MESILDLQNPSSSFWVFVGIALILLEVSLLPGVGFLFAGLGALTLAAMMVFELFISTGWTQNIAYFFFFTTIWAVVLWVPLKRALKSDPANEYKNMIGTYAEAEGVLEEGKIGNVKWSGAIMRARIVSGSSTKEVSAGETVWVHANKNGILHVDVVEPS